jgi:hypothetical protein
VIDTRLATIHCAFGPHSAWSLSSSCSFTSALSGGLALSQAENGIARLWEAAVLADYRVLQGGILYKSAIGFPSRAFLCGANLWLDRETGVNLSWNWASAPHELRESSVAIGLQFRWGQSLVRSAIGTDGILRSSVTRKILNNTDLTVGTEFTLTPLTCQLGLRVDIESHRF